MSDDSIDINIDPADEPVPFRVLKVSFRDAAGYPLEGEAVDLMIEGHGTFDAPSHVTTQRLVTDENGEALSQWWEFPRYEPRRPLHSTIRAHSDHAESRVAVENLHDSGGVRASQL